METKNQENRTTTLKKRPTQAITEKPSLDKVRNAIKAAVPVSYDADSLLDDMAENVLPRMKKTPQGTMPGRPEDTKKLWGAMYAFGTDTHLPLAESVGKNYRAMAMHNVREIEKEYDCKTTTEKMLAEIIAGSHARIMEHSRRLTTSFEIDYLTHEQISYYAMHGKEVDRAHRQMLNAIAMLKQIKSPPLSVNIHAKAAFVAQNQQVNAAPPKS